jgi:hypothetical protein
MAHWQKNYHVTSGAGGVTIIDHDKPDRKGEGNTMAKLMSEYEKQASCPVCLHADLAAIDAELDFDAEAGRQELGRIARLWHGDFLPIDVMQHISHRTPPEPSTVVRSYYESEAYLEKHPAPPEPPPPPPLAVIRVCAPLAQREDGGFTMVLFERDQAHPGGEAWIATDGKPAMVARTPAVDRLLRGGELILVEVTS